MEAQARREHSAGSASSVKSQKSDVSLGAYIHRVRKVAASCDAALEQQKAYFQSVPEELTKLQGQMVGVLTLVKELEGKEGGNMHSGACACALSDTREWRQTPSHATLAFVCIE